MKKAERKILEKNIITAVSAVLSKYDTKAAQKIKKTVKTAAKNVSKKFYKSAKVNQPKPVTAKSSKQPTAGKKTK